MRGVNIIGQGGDAFTAAVSEFGGDTARGLGEAGKDQHSTGHDRSRSPVGQTLRHSTIRAENERAISAEENLQTFPFHGRMETTDHAAPGVMPSGRLVRGLEDAAGGADVRAKQRGFEQGQRVEGAGGCQMIGRSGAQPPGQPAQPTRVCGRDSGGRMSSTLPL